MSNREYDRKYYPARQAPPGKVLDATIITCRRCGLQVILMDRADRQDHRWWDDLGWGKIAGSGHGRTGKGDLYCPDCYPLAHAQAVGEDVSPVPTSTGLDVTWFRSIGGRSYWHVLALEIYVPERVYLGGLVQEAFTTLRPGCQPYGWTDDMVEYYEPSEECRDPLHNRCHRCDAIAHLVRTGTIERREIE